MSLNIITMRSRLIWHEFLPHSESSIYPYISFDDGLTWMDIKDEVDYLRNVGERDLNIITTKNNINEMDMSIAFTPYSIPKIEKLEYVLSANNGAAVTQFISTKSTTYYFTVNAINYDTPGLNTVAESEHISYSGPVNIATSAPYMANVKSITIPNDGKYYNINMYVNFPNFIEGLAIYYGTTNTALKLMSITNLHQKLNGSSSINAIVANSTSQVALANKFPLPTQSGKIRVNEEYLTYTNQTWNGTNWVLTISPLATNSHRGQSTVMYCLPDDTKQLPEKLYFYPKTENMIQYINFDSNSVTDLVDHTGENDYIKPASIGTIEYSTFMSKFKNSYKLVGNTCIKTNLSETNKNKIKNTGSIHFYVTLSSFDNNTSSDPYIFGTYNTKGLYCRISRHNNKPYLGFRYINNENNIIDITIYSFEDFRIPALKKSEFSDIGIAWSKDSGNNMIFYLSIDGTTNIKTETSILNSDFTIGDIMVGGIYDGNSVVDSFVGYLDDWRIYDKNLADGSHTITFADISRNHHSDVNRFAGKIKLGAEFINTPQSVTSYDTVSASNLLAQGTAGGGATYYTPAFYTQVSLPYQTSYVNDEPLVKYDRWPIASYIMGGWTQLVTDITYPVKPERIKIKYELSDDTSGFFTPLLGNPSVIISELTV